MWGPRSITVKPRRQRGFTTTELMLVLGVGTVVIAAAFYGYKRVSEENADRANAFATSSFFASIKAKWHGIGSYSAVNRPNVIAAGLVVKPFTASGTTSIMNPYGYEVLLFGSPAEFFALMTIPKSKCIATITALDAVAYRIYHSNGAIKDVGVPLSAWNGKCGPDMGDSTNMIMTYVK